MTSTGAFGSLCALSSRVFATQVLPSGELARPPVEGGTAAGAAPATGTGGLPLPLPADAARGAARANAATHEIRTPRPPLPQSTFERSPPLPPVPQRAL